VIAPVKQIKAMFACAIQSALIHTNQLGNSIFLSQQISRSSSKGLFGTAYAGFGFIYFAQIEAL